MIPTKFHELTNQQVKEKLSHMTARREDGGFYLLVNPNESVAIIQEAMNRLDALDNIKKLFERPAYAQMSLDIMPNYELELSLKVNNGGNDK